MTDLVMDILCAVFWLWLIGTIVVCGSIAYFLFTDDSDLFDHEEGSW